MRCRPDERRARRRIAEQQGFHRGKAGIVFGGRGEDAAELLMDRALSSVI